MIIDAHTHLFPPSVRSDRSAFLSPSETAFAAIYSNPKAVMCGVEDLVAMMDEEGVDMSVACGFPWAREDTAKMHNDYLLEAQSRYPDRIISLACFDPTASWAGREAERALSQGAKGLGELAVYGDGFSENTIDGFDLFAGLCREWKAPLLVHVNEPIGHRYPGKAPLTLEMIYRLIQTAQGVRLVLAHWGGGVFFYNLLKKEVPAALTDVYYDTAASPFLYRPDIYDLAARIVGPEKIFFGSDYPLIRPNRYFKEMEGAGLAPDVAGMIKGDSAANVFLAP